MAAAYASELIIGAELMIGRLTWPPLASASFAPSPCTVLASMATRAATRHSGSESGNTASSSMEPRRRITVAGNVVVSLYSGVA